MIPTSEPLLLVSHSQILKAIQNAKVGQTFHVRTYTFRQICEVKAVEVGRQDIKFVVKKE